MCVEPTEKRAIAFVDGQNLFNAVKRAFGYTFPNYDPMALARAVCETSGWKLAKLFFYTGIPDPSDKRHQFWTAKLAALKTRGASVFSRPIRYSNQPVKLADGTVTSALVGREKGIDVRIALDAVRLARERAYDVAIFFCQDQDLSEAADEIKAIAKSQGRWVLVACGFPVSPVTPSERGINGARWIKIDRQTYDQCIDPVDYRQKHVKQT